MWRLATRNRPSTKVEAENEPAIRSCHISQEALPCRVTRCKGSKSRDRGTKWCRSASTWGSAIFLPEPAKLLLIDNLFSKSFGIREGKGFHPRVSRPYRTSAATAFRRGQSHPKWGRLRSSTIVPRLREHRGAGDFEVRSAGSSKANAT